ncbi:ATP23 [Symbiodinium microadriaticum]|nr:ATP23 [Symbiodinium sp. KB8]CAE7740887.1 ATP23 [Symbiodinium microadriaticum]
MEPKCDANLSSWEFKACQLLSRQAFGYWKVEILVNALSAMKAPVDLVCVRCPSDVRHRAGYSPRHNRIWMCANRFWNPFEFRRVLVHELTHAFDFARAKVDPGSCTHMACTEIRAWNLSGECDLWPNSFKYLGEDMINRKQRCVRDGALASLLENERCQDRALAGAALHEAWDQCWKDYWPFTTQPEPVPMPPTIVMEKQYWSFLSTYSMNEFRFAMNKGACKVETGVPSCVGLPLTAVECAAACEKSGTCIGFDRPNIYGKGGCCLYHSGGSITSDGEQGKACFILETPAEVRAKGSHHFGEVWREPSLYSTMHLSTGGDGSAKAIMDLCMPWSHCSFRIYTCKGQPLYALHARMMQSIDNPLLSVWAYEVRNSSGHYLGRTSELQSGYHPIEIYDARDRNVVTLATVWSTWSALYSGTWYINNQFPEEPIERNLMADARLVTFLAAHQFAAQGWFGPFWSIVLWVLLIVALYFGIQWCRKACESDSSNVSILLAEAKERLGCGKEEASSEEEEAGCLGSPSPRTLPVADVDYRKPRSTC